LSTEIFTITVDNVNRRPILASVGDQTLDEGTTLDVAVSASDPDDDPITLSASGLPSFATLTDNGDGTGTLALVPGFNDAGVYPDVEIAATDGDLAASQAFTITVNDVNRAPILASIGDQALDEGATLDVTVSASDPDGDPIILSSVGLPAFATFTDHADGTGTLSLAPSFDDAGGYPGIEVMASDGALTDTEVFTITVNDVNRPPSLTSIGDQTLDEGTTLDVAVSASDPDGDPISLSASGLPAFATLTDNGGGTGLLTLAPGFDDVGVYSDVEIVASDGDLTDTETFTITVNDVNRSPVADADGSYVVDEGSTITLDGSGSWDPDGDALSYEWQFQGQSFFDVSADISLSDDSSDTATLIVDDGRGGTGSDSAAAIFNNVAPTVDAGPDATINEGDTFISNGSFTDPGADDWTATVDYDDGSGVQPLALNPDQTFSLTHVYTISGIYTVIVTVADDDGGVGSDTATVTVLPPVAELWAVQYRWGDPYPGYSYVDWPIFEGWMNVRIENRSSLDVYNVVATITDWPIHTTVPDPDVTVGDIPAGSSAWSGDTFTVRVDMMLPGVDPCEGVFWRIEYDDAAGSHHVIEDVPEFPPGEGPCG